MIDSGDLERSSAQVAADTRMDNHHRGAGEPRIFHLPTWFKWSMAVGIYGVLWLPIAIGIAASSIDTPAGPLWPVAIPPVLFAAVPLALLALWRAGYTSAAPFRFLGITVAATAVLIVVAVAIGARPRVSEYLDYHPAAETWAWVVVLVGGEACALGVEVIASTRSRTVGAGKSSVAGRRR